MYVLLTETAKTTAVCLRIIYKLMLMLITTRTNVWLSGYRRGESEISKWLTSRDGNDYKAINCGNVFVKTIILFSEICDSVLSTLLVQCVQQPSFRFLLISQAILDEIIGMYWSNQVKNIFACSSRTVKCTSRTLTIVGRSSSHKNKAEILPRMFREAENYSVCDSAIFRSRN